MLSLTDISGTMARPADSTGITRMQAISQVGIEGLKLFPDKTEIGIWVFSDNLNGDKGRLEGDGPGRAARPADQRRHRGVS